VLRTTQPLRHTRRSPLPLSWSHPLSSLPGTQLTFHQLLWTQLCLVKHDILQAARLHLGFDQFVCHRLVDRQQLRHRERTRRLTNPRARSANNPTFPWTPTAARRQPSRLLFNNLAGQSNQTATQIPLPQNPRLRRATIDCSGIAQSTSNQQPTGQGNLCLHAT
jgi:hypothetical protein